jgi:signal transduction histidine kinase
MTAVTEEGIKKRPSAPERSTILLGTRDVHLLPVLRAQLWRTGEMAHVTVAISLAQLRAQSEASAASVIVVDLSLLHSNSGDSVLAELTAVAPLIFLLEPTQIHRTAQLLALSDSTECVIRAGEFAPLLAALIERRIRWAGRAASPAQTQLPASFGEILRHEINNPLTGILGNAEMLLAQRDRLPIPAVQRLETVVDLAVRLRETIRRLSQQCDPARASVHTA